MKKEEKQTIVQVIAAEQSLQQCKETTPVTKLCVAAYCRVSTDMEEQEKSYEAQCRHYREYIRSNPAWKLAGIYADEGISGTSTKNRSQFRKMIRACERGKIDLIVTKSISRFARNTLDCLQTIRRLKELGIAVYFEKENINTLDAKGELLITIMASVAQQESQSISQNVRLGIQYRFKQGEPKLNSPQFLGLKKEGSRLVIVPEEADLVRRIFRAYLDGDSPARIARQLTEEKIPAPAGGPTWYQSTIASMLENEKYAGDLLLQKYYTEDFLTHRIRKNEGQLPQYFVKDAHEPIIPREVFAQVQRQLHRRSYLMQDPKRFRCGSQKILPGRLICGICGRTLKRYRLPSSAETAPAAEWRCRKRAYQKRSETRELPAACPCRNIPEAEALAAIFQAFRLLPEKQETLFQLKKDLETRLTRHACSEVPDQAPNDTAAGSLQAPDEPMPSELQFAETEHQLLQIRNLQEWIEQEKGNAAGRYPAGQMPACKDSEDFYRRTAFQLPKVLPSLLPDALVLRYLQQVIICENRYQVQFKAGVSIDIPL